ncbi:copper resistance CopC/CopD family protein [Halovivax limisalsi]|uniref:copper resistance CopC/CopD family protein n=1 Tax=Halovivax limisalsi TaxID=1453760 RepID=UPI001FFD74C7|nr:copper resistance protein CopC [Halovivax limisalsi]
MPTDDSSHTVAGRPTERAESRRDESSATGRRRDDPSTKAGGATRGDSATSPLGKIVALACLFVLVCGLLAAPVAAHAYLDETTPGNGEQVETLPEELALAFSGDGIQVAEVEVTGPNGDVVSGSAVVDADDRRLVRVPLAEADDGAPAPEGMYTVEWEILSDDGHTTDGSFFFTVGDGPIDRDAIIAAATADDGDASVSPFEAGAKGLLLLAIVALVGVPVTARTVVYPVLGRDGSTSARIDRRLRTVLLVPALALAPASLAYGAVQATALGGASVVSLTRFLETGLGRLWLIQFAVAIALAVGLTVSLYGLVPIRARVPGGIERVATTGESGIRTRRLSRRVWLAGSVVGGGLALATVSWSSHSATAVARLSGTAVDAAHVLGAGVWVGGLVVLATVVPPVLAETPATDRFRLAAALIRRFSILAMAGVTLVVATGFLLAAWHAPTVDAIVASLYGVALSTKVVLVILALGLAGFSRMAVLHRLESPAGDESLTAVLRALDPAADVRSDGGTGDASGAEGAAAVSAFVRAVRVEAGVLLLVVVLSGLITSAPTAAVAGAGGGFGEATLERDAGDLDLSLTATPGDRSAGNLTVHRGEPIVFDVAAVQDGERVRSDRGVRLVATNPEHDTTMNVDLRANGDGTYSTVQTLPDPDGWRLRVTGLFDGTYVDEWFDVRAIAGDGRDRGTGTRAETPFSSLLRLGALAVGLLGTIAVGVESIHGRGRER